jgi:hypothetical protein
VPVVNKRVSKPEEKAQQELVTFRLLFVIVVLIVAIGLQLAGNRYVRHYARIFTERAQMVADPRRAPRTSGVGADTRPSPSS